MDKFLHAYFAVMLILSALQLRPVQNALLAMFVHIAPDAYLIERSRWDECDGTPMNIWAEELERRDEVRAAAAMADKGE